MKNVKILVIQYKVRYLNIEANLKKFRKILNRYKYLKPDLVIFPEYALTGPLYSNYNLALNQENKVLLELSSMAKKHIVNLIPGSFIVKKGNDLFNSSCFITSKGLILDFYDKKILWSSEKRYLQSGTKNNLFKTDKCNISIQICADLRSSLTSSEYRKLKPDLIVNIAMWSYEDIKTCTKYVPPDLELIQTELLARTRALENKCYMIFCNFGSNLNIKTKMGKEFRVSSTPFFKTTF